MSRTILRLFFPYGFRESARGKSALAAQGRGVYCRTFRSSPVPKEINILVIDNDPGSQNAIQMIMDGEGWRLKIVDEAEAALKELAQGSWALVVASVPMVDFSGPLFQILKDLAQSAPVEDGKSRVRVLFVVPASMAQQAVPVLEEARVPFAMKPYALNDLLEKVNDLLLQAQFLSKTARERGFAFEQGNRPKKGKSKKAAASNSMFASRDEYFYTEEELAEYEKEQKEDEKKRKLNKRPI